MNSWSETRLQVLCELKRFWFCPVWSSQNRWFGSGDEAENKY